VVIHIDAGQEDRDVEMVVVNKVEQLSKCERGQLTQRCDANLKMEDQISCVPISAITGEGLDELMEVIESELSRKDHFIHVLLKPQNYDVRAWLHQNGHVISEKTCKNGDCEMEVQLSSENSGRFLSRHKELIVQAP